MSHNNGSDFIESNLTIVITDNLCILGYHYYIKEEKKKRPTNNKKTRFLSFF
jgi:hypothetical protein